MASATHTFLFTDLVGFTALTAERGDDHAADVALDFSLRTRRIAESRRAELVKSLGDGLMLRCGDPAEAVYLGVEIVDALAEVPGFPAVRVGMHTGSAVQREGDWFGGTVNVASRLCTAASGGEVLVSAETVRAAPRLREISIGEQRLHWLKNVVEPVAAHPVGPAPSLATRLSERVPGLRARFTLPTTNHLPEAMA